MINKNVAELSKARHDVTIEDMNPRLRRHLQGGLA